VPITLDIKMPDYLKPVFDDDRAHMVVRGGRGARNALLMWLWSKGNGVWISQKPKTAHQALRELLVFTPRARMDRVDFRSPADLGHEQYDYCVVESSFGMTDVTVWCGLHVDKSMRVLEPGEEEQKVSSVDRLGLSIEERKNLLLATRFGSEKRYSEYDLIASITRESFYEFVKEFWSMCVMETFIDNWHISYLCKELQAVVENMVAGNDKLYDLIINISPGSTKSTLASVMLPAWTWTRMSSARIIGASYAHNLAMDLSRKNRDLVQSSKYQKCFPMALKDDQNTKSYFANDRGGMRMGVGMGGVAGFHAHLLVIDDPINPNSAVSEVEMRTCNAWMTETLGQRKVNQAKTPTILIMQRLHQNDPTANMLVKNKNTKFICLPAEVSENLRPIELQANYKDGLMDPVRLPRATLEEKRATLGEYGYSGQYLQHPVPLSGGMFKTDRFRVEQLNGSKLIRVVRYWDKAGTEGGGCYTVGVKMGIDNKKHFWVLDVVRGQWDSAQREDVIKFTTQLDGVAVLSRIEQEPGSGGKQSAQDTIKNLAGFNVAADRPVGNKALRADPFSVQVNAGNASMVPAVWNVDYLSELSYFPLGRFKDQVDASSGAFAELTTHKVVGGWS